MSKPGTTTYSDMVKGDRRNYDWAAKFDLTDGYLGINQYDGETLKDRILLSPAQVRALVEFVSGKKTRKAA